MDNSCKKRYFGAVREDYNIVVVDRDDYSNAIQLLLVQVISGKQVICEQRDEIEYYEEGIKKLKDKFLRIELIGRGMRDMLYEKEHETFPKGLLIIVRYNSIQNYFMLIYFIFDYLF